METAPSLAIRVIPNAPDLTTLSGEIGTLRRRQWRQYNAARRTQYARGKGHHDSRRRLRL